jgi:hypothetical protein
VYKISFSAATGSPERWNSPSPFENENRLLYDVIHRSTPVSLGVALLMAISCVYNLFLSGHRFAEAGIAFTNENEYLAFQSTYSSFHTGSVGYSIPYGYFMAL